MSLATVDDGGVWVSDVIFIYDDNFNIYWMSDPDVRHSLAIEKDKKVAGAIVLSNKLGEKSLAIQFSGVAKKIDGARYDLALKHYKKTGKPEPKEEDDVLEGDSWYELTPTKMRLNDMENFGYDKQDVEL